jgi:hypothetical protein
LILEGTGGEQLATNDDGGPGWNASLHLTLPESGDYSIGITSVERAVGAYQLAIRSGAP